MNDMIPETAAQDALTWVAIIKALLMLVAGWFLARVATRLFRSTAGIKLGAHHLAIYSRGIFYAIFAIFIFAAIQQLGFDISVLLGAAGILTVAVGFASQTSASNLISGLFLLGEKPFEVGDVLRVDGETGEVVSIDLLSVKLRTFDNLFVRLPNETLIKNKVVNLTKFPIRRIDLVVGVAYREDLKQVIALLLEVANNERRCLEEPQPFCGVTLFNTSSVDVLLAVWCRKELFREVKSDLLVAIKETFDKHDIEIPFPHVSLYSGSRTGPIPLRTISDD
jgi:small-conductance mechanosensitive channel